jgi:hypothetical protein
MTTAEAEIVEVKLTTRTAKGTLVRSGATLEYANGRIYFLKSPFSLKDEIKAMKGSKWHGFDDDHYVSSNGREYKKIWSILDCQRNRFQLSFLTGEDVYEWFDRDLIEHDYGDVKKNGVVKELMRQQRDMADAVLTYHYQIFGAEMGTGKTLAAMLAIILSGVKTVWWVGPRTSLPNMRREFNAWGFDFDKIEVVWMTYEELVRRMDEWKPGDFIPQFVVWDESSRLKGATSQRNNAAQMLADLIREKYGFDGYVLEMSGTPSPKSPCDWWAQSEIAWPGFLREGSPKQLEQRLAFMSEKEFGAGIFKDRDSWKDDERKCKTCGKYEADGPHVLDGIIDPRDVHKYETSVNEVALMYDRLKGLARIWHKKDCLDLPDKRYRRVVCKPAPSLLRVGSALMQAAPNTITGLTWMRELSDGFQYKEIKDGTSPCPHCPESSGVVEEWFDKKNESRVYSSIDMVDPKVLKRLAKREAPCPLCNGDRVVDKMVRITREVPCPKEDALKLDLERCEETGRVVIFAGFTGSVDRITNICRKEGWAVVRCDGRGWEVSFINSKSEVEIVTCDGDAALAYWSDLYENLRVAFVSHPESGGMSLTLVEARMAIFWSNSFKPEYRAQAEDRIHRMGMDENLGCEIVDYIHLPTDERVIQVIRDNRKIELLTMGDFTYTDDGVLVACENATDDYAVEYLSAA